MTEMKKYPPGTFSWIDLATTDAEAAKAFYTTLFGWEAEDMPAGPDAVYTMLSKNGKSAAGLYAMSAEQQSMGMPPNWMSYISVADADATAEKAKSLGGQVMAEPFDVMEAGRMAVLQGPTGEMFAVWQPKDHIGSQVVNEPGTLSWNELATNDTAKAGQFYTSLFGWTSQVQEMPMTTYTTFSVGERMNAGMMQMTEEWGDMPPHWMVYFAVEDCDASAAKAQSLGGEVGVPPTDIPPIGRFSVIKDPQGAHFTIIKLNNPD